MIHRKSAAVVVLCIVGSSAYAQVITPADPPSLVQLKVITGVPFSAQVLTESTQALADGNRIARKTTAKIARDSEGRTRREQHLPTGAASAVVIHDPVEQ